MRILAGPRVPTGQRADGRVVVFGSFDAVYWTQDVARYAAAVQALVPAGATGREVWLGGLVSPRARAEFERLGWTVHDRAEESLAEKPGV